MGKSNDAQLVLIEGEVFEYSGSKSGRNKTGAWVLHKFVVVDANGAQFTCQTFDAFDPSWVGMQVSFEAEHNEQYDSYLAKGAITVANGEEATEDEDTTGPEVRNSRTPAAKPVAKPAATARPAARAAAPAKATRPAPARRSAAPAAKAPKSDDRESRREEAIASTRKDLDSALALAAEYGYASESITLAELVSLADRIGRTITATGR